MLTSRRLILLAGAALIAAGIGALFWSHALASGSQAAVSAWWQGTLQALGVGFIVGGLVDVLAISIMNQMLSGSPVNPNHNRQARRILAAGGRRISYPPDYARMFLEQYGKEIDPLLRARLQELADRNRETP
jgi:hypothetical protein